MKNEMTTELNCNFNTAQALWENFHASFPLAILRITNDGHVIHGADVIARFRDEYAACDVLKRAGVKFRAAIAKAERGAE